MRSLLEILGTIIVTVLMLISATFLFMRKGWIPKPLSGPVILNGEIQNYTNSEIIQIPDSELPILSDEDAFELVPRKWADHPVNYSDELNRELLSASLPG